MKIFKIIILFGIFSGNAAYCQQKTQARDSIEVTALKCPGAIRGNNVHINDSNLDKYVGT